MAWQDYLGGDYTSKINPVFAVRKLIFVYHYGNFIITNKSPTTAIVGNLPTNLSKKREQDNPMKILCKLGIHDWLIHKSTFLEDDPWALRYFIMYMIGFVFGITAFFIFGPIYYT